jgi:hypothetical protein
MSWRDKVARFFGLGGDRTRPAIKPWPADNIDPIEELARTSKRRRGWTPKMSAGSMSLRAALTLCQ